MNIQEKVLIINEIEQQKYYERQEKIKNPETYETLATKILLEKIAALISFKKSWKRGVLVFKRERAKANRELEALKGESK